MRALRKLTDIRNLRKTFVNFGGDLIPFQPTAFDFKTREAGSNLVIDALGGDSAEIVGGVVADMTGSNYMSQNNSDNLYVIRMTIFTESDIISTTPYNIIGSFESTLGLLATGSIGSNVSFETLTIWGISGEYATYIRDTIPAGINAIELVWNVNKYDIYINGDKKVTYSAPGGECEIQSGNIFIGKRESSSAYFNGLIWGFEAYITAIEYSQIESSIPKYSFPLNGNVINIVDGIEADFIDDKYTEVTDIISSTQDALDKGFYQNDADPTIQVVDPQYPLLVGWTHHLGGKLHNGINSFWKFPNTLPTLNRTTQTAASTGSIYYDSGNPFTYHNSEVPYDVLNTYLTTPQTVFTKITDNYCTPLAVTRIAGFTLPLVGADLESMLKYIGRLCEGNYVTNNGVLVTNNGIQVTYTP